MYVVYLEQIYFMDAAPNKKSTWSDRKLRNKTKKIYGKSLANAKLKSYGHLKFSYTYTVI